MEIFAFQLFVILSIAFIRVFARKALFGFCAVWSIFTFFAVFATPLILLQLVTIWAAYSWFRPRPDAESDDAVPIVQSQPHQAVAVNDAKQKRLNARSRISISDIERLLDPGSTPQMAKGQAGAVDLLDAYVSHKKAVQEATEKLSLVIREEQNLLESVIDRAEQSLATERKFADDPITRKFYEAEKARLTALFGNASETPMRFPARPDFSIPTIVSDETIGLAIRRKVHELQAEHHEFLAKTAKRLAADERLLAVAAQEAILWQGQALWAELVTLLPASQKTLATVTSSPSSMAIDGTDDTLSRTFRHHSSILKTKVEAMNIPHLIHFTRMSNLRSISQHGLLPISLLNRQNISFNSNDKHRLDGQTSAISLSVAHPNEKMFFKYRMAEPEVDWVVLVIDPSVLWSKPVAFCRYNAADKRSSSIPIAERMTTEAFDSLFAEEQDAPSRGSQDLRPYDPTDVQAEVLVFEQLSVELIKGVALTNSNAATQIRKMLHLDHVVVQNDGQGFFGPRLNARKRKSWERRETEPFPMREIMREIEAKKAKTKFGSTPSSPEQQ